MSRNIDARQEQALLERKRQIDQERRAQAILQEQARRRATAILMAQVAEAARRQAPRTTAATANGRDLDRFEQGRAS